MSLDPRRLLVLAAVRRAGGVLAAARVLHLTPSAVSQQLARLEAETGAVVLDRSRAGGGRSAVLSAAGELLASYGDRVAELLAEADGGLAELTGAVRGPVRIGAFPTAIGRLVAPALVDLARSHPAVEPHVVEVDPGPGRDALHRGALHVLLVEEQSDATAPTAHAGPRRSTVGQEDRVVLLDDPFHLVVPVTWPRPDDLDALLHRRWTAGPPGSAARDALHRLAADRGLPPPVSPHEALGYPAVLALVGAGLGPALVPMLALQQTPHPGVRRAVPPVTAGSRQLSALTRPGSSPAAHVVLEALLIAANT